MNSNPLRPSRSWVAALTAPLIALAVFSVSVTPAQASPRMLTAEQLASGKPTTFVLDPKTGAILESWLTDPTADAQVSQRSPCNTGDACYVAATPYADQGFYGSNGTKTGSWPMRISIHTNNYKVNACWNYQGAGHCTNGTLPKDNITFFDGARVTGTSLKITN